ncbi:MAG TPA: hypothetical protein VNO70_10820 [Blastocatellia bacterium]|nr:hypothetical protein [Blastocatellia bacterium]
MIKIGFSVLGILTVGVVMIFMTGVVLRSKDRPGNLSKIQTVGLSEYGIEIVGPTEAAFTTLMSKQLQKTSRMDIDTLKSSSAFVINNSGQSIAALKVKWELLQRDGRRIVHYQSFSGGLRVISDAGSAHLSEEIALKDHRLVSLLVIPNGPDGSFRVNLGGGGVDKARQLSESVKVTISVDGVLFGDGTFVGPDTGDFFESLKAEIEARTDVLEEFARALNGDSEAMKRIKMVAKGDHERIQMSSGKAHPKGQLERERLARVTLAIRKNLGDKAVLERINAELSKPRINLRKL